MNTDIKKILTEANNLNNQGKNEEAKILYFKILEDYPDNPDANHNLAIILIRENKVQEARLHIERFLSTDFPMAEYYNTAGRYYLMINEVDMAISLLEKSIDMNSNDPKPFYLKAVAHKQKSEFEEALPLFKKVYELQPNVPEIMNSYGVALASVQKYEESIEIYRKAIKINPESFDLCTNLALSLQKTHMYVEAKKNYKKALAIKPNDPFANLNFASMYQALGHKEKTLEYYSKAKEIIPNNSELYNNIGTAYGEFGEKLLAKEMYEKSLEIDPENFKVYRHYATTGLLKKDSQITRNMMAYYENEMIKPQDKAELGFGLGFIFDKEKEFTKAFNYLKNSHDFYERKYNYNIEKVKNEVNKMKEIYKKNKLPFSDKEIDISPIFIVGMPRSGTTMLERIISNNKNVDALGELTTISSIALRIKKGEIGFPEILNNLTEKDYTKIRADYIQAVKQITPDIKKRFTDKMPYNFLYIGLIRSLFPSCKIINIVRDSRDTCLSIYMLKLFGTHRYSHNLENLGKYYNMYFNLMDFWKEIFPENLHSEYESILTIRYEDLVYNTVEQTKIIMDYCELDYTEGMERFDLNTNNVRTASNHQVREKMTNISINRWKNYENSLDELLMTIDERSFYNS